MRLITCAAACAAAALLAPAGAAAAVTGPFPATGASPFPPGCNGAPQNGAVYRDTEVEPFLDLNPVRPQNLTGVYQQDRYETGGANGLGTSFSEDGGATWTRLGAAALPKFTRCAGAAPGSVGDYERASDPWVTYGPDGDAYQISLSFNDTRDLASGVLVSESKDGGHTWGPVKQLIRDTANTVFNDKESITADPTSARYVYAVWDRLVFPNERAKGQSYLTAAAFRGPAYFSRSTDGGASWEGARAIYDPGQNDQTIGNEIVVLPDGTLLDGFARLASDNKTGRKGAFVTMMRSTTKGATWSAPTAVGRLGSIGVTDPRDGTDVRTGDIIPQFATDRRSGTSNVYAVWQDARFNGFQREQIAFARSTDGGRTWSSPVRVSRIGTTQAFTPQVRVDDTGALYVTYYDFRNDTAASASLDTDAWVARSTDGGRTWTENRLTATPFDMRTAPFALGYFVGDYEGLATRGNAAYPFDSISRASTDVFAWRAAPPLSGPTYTPSTSEGANVPKKAFPVAHGRPAPA